jgi:hypothetical protein
MFDVIDRFLSGTSWWDKSNQEPPFPMVPDLVTATFVQINYRAEKFTSFLSV